jgi:hypothetical protein
MAVDRPRSQISKLQPGRIDFLVSENQVEVGHGTEVIRAIANSSEGELEIVVLSLPSTFNDDVRSALVLPAVLQECIGALHAEGERHIIWIGRMRVFLGQSLFVDNRGNYREIDLFDKPTQPFHKNSALPFIL